MWDIKNKYPQFKSAIVQVIGKKVAESMLRSEPGSTNYQNLINLRTKVREKTRKIISIIKDYTNTEVFIESYKDKTVQDILHDLYEGKIK